VAAFSNTGIGDPVAACLTNLHDVIFLGTLDFTKDEFQKSQNRLYSMFLGPSDVLTYAVRNLAPELKGKKVGVVYGDSDPDPQIVQEGLLPALKAEGIDVVRTDVIGCQGGPQCQQNIIPSVKGMVADGVQAIFPVLNGLSLPGYLQEMVTQGVKPGQFQFYNTSFNAQDSELIEGKIIQVGSKQAGALYNGAIIISNATDGDWRKADYQPDAFTKMCNDEYIANSATVHTPYDLKNDDQQRKAQQVAGHCAMIRILARALDAAGPNPSRAEIANAILNMGKVDYGGFPASFAPGKQTAPDAIVRLKFNYPCPTPVNNGVGHCNTTESDYLPLPQG